MRFVDIALLELPNGWQGHADEALNALRDEITQAEAVARAAGEDPVAARRAAQCMPAREVTARRKPART